MGASPFGLRTIIVVLLTACGAVQIISTFRKSLRLSLFLENDAPISKAKHNQQHDELILPDRVPWGKQQTKTTIEETPPTADDDDDHDDPRQKNANNSTTTATTTATTTNAKEKPNKREVWATQQQKRVQPQSRPLFLEDVTHFLSHIPKSGTEYAHSELVHLHQSTIRLPNNRTISAVRSAQIRFNRTGYQGNFLVASQKAELVIPIPLDITGDTDGYTPPMICNQATTPFAYFKPYYVGKGVRYRCDFFVSEQPWNGLAEYVYTIVREPFSHVLSQYFHCTESRDHQSKKEHMPSLDEWLESFANLTDANLSDMERKKKVNKMRRSFKCYDPIDSESAFTQFNRKLPENYTYPYPYTERKGDENKRLDRYLFDDLKRRYRIIGDTSRMVKSVCAIFISYTDGKQIPEICDCTNPRIVDDINSNSTSTSNSSQFYVRDLQKDPHGKQNGVHSKIKMGYNPIKHSHGVAHHGSSFLEELTPRQRGLIAKIRKKDQVLYNISRAVFDQQILEMEAAYGIKVCDDWNRPIQMTTSTQPKKTKRASAQKKPKRSQR